MEIYLAWISVGLGAAGIVYGISQDRLRARIERLAALQAWDMYQSAYQSLGWFSDARKEPDPDKRERILADAYVRADTHYAKSIHNVYTNHKKVSPELIDKWVSEGRIKEHEKEAFLRLNGEP